MRKNNQISLWTVLAVLLLLAGTSLRAETGFVHTNGQQLVTPDGKTLMLRGTNLGNWLEPEGYMFHFAGGPQSPREIEQLFNELIGPAAAEAFWRQYRKNYITEQDIAFLHRTGFNVVRVPMHYKFFESDPSEGFALIDQLVKWCRQNHIYIILDMHCAPGGQTGANIDDSWNYPWLYESPESQQQLIDTWKRIAHHYRNEPTILGYDLLNEPIPNFPQLQKYNKDLEPIYKRVTAAIRTVDRHHVVILGGAQWDGNFSVFGKPFDKNVMYTFHQYWMPPTQHAVQKYVDFRSTYNVPIWLGESGENNDAWITQYRELLDKNQISWTFWPYKKMDATSSPVSFNRPPHWDEIVAFAKQPLLSGDAKKQIASRPSLEDAKEALQGILENVKFANCRVNDGYMQALGLHVAATAHINE
ncbi:MAG: glycoside hydrolase family 5 protein [Acidobacteriaceae bacterium]